MNFNATLNRCIENTDQDMKIIWGNCLDGLKKMKSESIHLLVTSPPYYNAREYSTWRNLDAYLKEMTEIIQESYRVLDNHRVFVFNIGDIFDNDNMTAKSVWANRRLPLGAYFTKIFEEAGFTFVDDFIWNKGEVQSSRHKNGSTPYPFYQYPMNTYEHIYIFHKHRLDKTKYPCPVCGSLKVNSNSQCEIGIQSWECKNMECFERSKANRGKRFSLKSNVAQRMQQPENKISEELVKKWRKDIVNIQPVFKINSKGENILGHSAPFPKEIPEMAVEFFSYKGERVLDPFGGSFTTPIVAKKHGRIGIGIELQKEMYRAAILNRIKKEFNTLDGMSEYTLKTGAVKKHSESLGLEV